MRSEESANNATSVIVEASALDLLFDALHERGYTVVGPTVRDGAIMIEELASAAALPYGWGVDTEAGHYRLRRREDTAAFGHSAGPQSWKDVLHPARARLWSADRTPDGGVTTAAEPHRGGFALFGARPCDLAAIGVLDRVLSGGTYADPVYTSRRDGTFVIAVDCTEPSATCFCVSMGGGPGATTGFDLAMTELVDAGQHTFLVRCGSLAGAEILAALPSRPAGTEISERAADAVLRAAAGMRREHSGAHTLQPTALVNEAYMRLTPGGRFENRRHFFGAAAQAMRRILVDHARAKSAEKRGGGQERVTLSELDVAVPEDDLDVLAVNDALERLSQEDPRLAELVNLRFFAGMSIEDAARALDVSPATVKRDWVFARAWLVEQVQNYK